MESVFNALLTTISIKKVFAAKLNLNVKTSTSKLESAKLAIKVMKLKMEFALLLTSSILMIKDAKLGTMEYALLVQQDGISVQTMFATQ